MQRASASAREAGLSFEWLGAYIATVSEQTRQAPETIGTAFNSMMSRLQNIKANGFNEEDETKINDVAKALASLEKPITIIDEKTGEWRDMSTIFMEIAEQWGEMDDKARAYIATTMAGTRQKNVFLTLMDDLSKVNSATGEASRAMELYIGAMDAAGTASAKYAVWQETVTAAQGRMQTSLESLYTTILSSDVLKGFYNTVANVADAAARGADGMGKQASAVVGVAVAVTVLTASFQAAKAAGEGVTLLSWLSGGKLVMGLSAFVAAAGAAAVAIGAIKKAIDQNRLTAVDNTGLIEAKAENIAEIEGLITRYEELAGMENRTAAESAEMESIFNKLKETSGDLGSALDQQNLTWVNSADVIATTTEKLREYRDEQNTLSQSNIEQKINRDEFGISALIEEYNKAQKYSGGNAEGKSIQGLYDYYERYGENPLSVTDAEGGAAKASRDFLNEYEGYLEAIKNQMYAEAYETVWENESDAANVKAKQEAYSDVSAMLDAFREGMDAALQDTENGNDYAVALSEMLDQAIKTDDFDIQKLRDAYQREMDAIFAALQNTNEYNELDEYTKGVVNTIIGSIVDNLSDEKLLDPNMQNVLPKFVEGLFGEFSPIPDDLGEKYNEQMNGILTVDPADQEAMAGLEEQRNSINETLEALNTRYEGANIPLIAAQDELAKQAIETGETMSVALDSSDIYQDILMTREELSGFNSVFDQLGNSAGKLNNVNDAVLKVARNIAEALGQGENDEKIKEIGQSLLTSLYDTYPGIKNYVDVMSGEIRDGWDSAIQGITNPWAEFLEERRMDEALEAAKEDMQNLDFSKVWNEILSPEGKGLYKYAEQWANAVLPDDRTEQDVRDWATKFAEAFYEMFDEIDSTIIGGDGRIRAGMESVIQTMRESVAQIDSVVASVDSTNIQRDALISRAENNGFAAVLSRVGGGEGQLDNLNDAVLSFAEGIAEAIGKAGDQEEISSIGQSILESLYNTYPDIENYVDVVTGKIKDGWDEGISELTNPWKEYFDEMRMDDALAAAQKDMAKLDASALWDELLKPDGQTLTEYAEEWAKGILPADSTQAEIQEYAQRFVDAFFDMFEEIDSTFFEGNGRIKAGMDEQIQAIREGAVKVSDEADNLAKAYEEVNGESLNIDSTIQALQSMFEEMNSGNQQGAVNIFNEQDDESLELMVKYAADLVAKLHEGVAAASDVEVAIESIQEAEKNVGKDAFKEYFKGTSDGLRKQTSDYDAAMREIIESISQAENKEEEFYNTLSKLSDEGLDISGLLDQYGGLCIAQINGTKSADELYEALDKVTSMSYMQMNIENAENLVGAAKAINPENEEYDPTEVLSSYAALENTYSELAGMQRGTLEYYETAQRQANGTADAVYEEAEAWGVVTDQQARMARAAAQGEMDRRFNGFDKNNYKEAIEYLQDSLIKPKNAGADWDVTASWKKAQDDLDEAGLLETMSEIFGNISELAVESEDDISGVIARLAEMYVEAQEFNISEQADQLREEREVGTAEGNDYREQLGELMEAYGEGGTEGVTQAMEVFSQFDEEMQSSIAKTYPSLVVAMDDANKAAKKFSKGIDGLEDDTDDMGDAARDAKDRIGNLGKEIESAQKTANARYFKDTARAFEDLRQGTISVDDAMNEYSQEVDRAITAQEEFTAANAKMAEGTEVTIDDIANLSEFLGVLDPSWLLDNWESVGPMMSNALAEGEAAFARLNDAAFIHITGSADADFSAVETGLISVENLTQEVIEMLRATGQWELETINLPQEGAVFNPKNRKWDISRINVGQTVLRYTGSNPLRSGFKRASTKPSGASSSGGSSGGGGGGGGGSSSDSSSSSSASDQMSEIEKMLDLMEQIQDIRKHQQDMIQETRQYYETTGQLQGVIKFYEEERAAIQANCDILRENIRRIEELLTAKQAEVAAMSVTDAGYEQAASDLEALQEAHQQYTLELLQSQTAIEQINQSIKDQQDAIRDMEIDLRETILQAIKDREELEERMLQGTISVENEILDIIKKRYEKERDMAIETSEAKIEALEEEIALLDEEFEKRKQLADKEDKEKTLREKQAQLERISADPTRRKEELELREEIAELREEMAWDQAEEEVEAQKDSLDQQIDSLEDYIEYVNDYYEDLFAHPQKLIEEMQELMNKTDEEIQAFLEANNEEFAAATEATQQSMVNNWQDMLMDMHGEVEDYWDEVESVIEGGDDAIIQFLMENSNDYKTAGKLQAEAYVDEWRQKLEDLRKAYQQVQEEITQFDYSTVRPPEGSGSSDSGGSSSSGGGGGSSSGSVSSGGSGGGYSGSGSSTGSQQTLLWKYRMMKDGKVIMTSTATFLTKDEAISAGKSMHKSFPAADLYVGGWKNGEFVSPVKVASGTSGSSTGSSGSGSSSSGSSSGGEVQGPTQQKRYGYNLLDKKGFQVGQPRKNGYTSYAKAEAAAKIDLQKTLKGKGSYKIFTYAKGGIADFTGVAWLDGTRTKPERILSPYQTELFEDLISSLHMIRANVASLPSTIGYEPGEQNSMFTFGDINVNVEQLSDDADYEEIGRKVMEQMSDMMARTSSVGGIRYMR